MIFEVLAIRTLLDENFPLLYFIKLWISDSHHLWKDAEVYLVLFLCILHQIVDTKAWIPSRVFKQCHFNKYSHRNMNKIFQSFCTSPDVVHTMCSPRYFRPLCLGHLDKPPPIGALRLRNPKRLIRRINEGQSFPQAAFTQCLRGIKTWNLRWSHHQLSLRGNNNGWDLYYSHFQISPRGIKGGQDLHYAHCPLSLRAMKLISHCATT